MDGEETRLLGSTLTVEVKPKTVPGLKEEGRGWEGAGQKQKGGVHRPSNCGISLTWSA